LTGGVILFHHSLRVSSLTTSPFFNKKFISMSTVSAPAPRTGHSPLPGCFLFIVGILVFSSLATWAVYSLVKQSQAISTFTAASADTLENHPFEAAQLTALNERLLQFEKDVWAGTGPSLTLSTDELNILITAAPSFASVKDTLRVKSNQPEEMTLHVALPMNALPWEPKRYLNGLIHAKPGVLPDKGLTFETQSIEVPGKKVTPEFIQNYQSGRFLDLMLIKSFREDQRFGPLVLKVTEASWQNGQLILKASTGAAKKLPD
jgi:hypothetical protein